MTDDITQRLRAAVPKMPDSGTPIAWPCKVRSELLLEAATEIAGLRAQLEDRYIAMRVRQLEHALDAERQTVRRLRENVDRLGKEVERADRLREEIARVKADNRSLVKRALEGKS